jgi:hypothetical protein
LLHSNGFKHVRKWLRPDKISVTNEEKYLPISLFSDPSPKDVIQGELGSCWFLSALALLVEKPFLLLNCMVTQYYNPKGFYQVRLCRRGVWVVVNVDDYLPVDKNNQVNKFILIHLWYSFCRICNYFIFSLNFLNDIKEKDNLVLIYYFQNNF